MKRKPYGGNRMYRILSAAQQETTTARRDEEVLAALFRKILGDLRITPQKWLVLLHEYVTDKRNGVPDNRRDQTSMRGNLAKEFSRDRMTWKVICKGLRLLGYRRFKITIQGWDKNNKEHIHDYMVDYGNEAPIDQEPVVFLDEGAADEITIK